jgi:hypothetical protein
LLKKQKISKPFHYAKRERGIILAAADIFSIYGKCHTKSKAHQVEQDGRGVGMLR